VFDSVDSGKAPPASVPCEEDWFDPAWLDQAPELSDTTQPPVSECAPSGWLALELDQGCSDPAGLSDAELIDAVIGFDRITSWASAPQARLLAEFARRRPGDHPLAARCDTPSRASEFAPDEIGLALRLSRTAATGRLVMAETLVADLPGTLAAWQAGTVDTLKARAITETGYLLPREQRGALEARVLPRAGQQTIAQLRKALARAVLAIDPHGAQDRHEQRCRDRRVVVSPDEEGMATADLDHTIPYQPDGTTSNHNLHASCRHHHRLKTHTTSWDIDQHPDGRITWTTPTGHTHTSHPHNYQPDPPEPDPPPF
jgi:hypothetical protein